MRQQGFLHFDAHLGNILTDGDTFYLTDFGLVLDEQFDLSDEERAFVAAHSHYDYGNYLEGLLWPLVAAYRTESEAEQQQIRQLYGIAEGTPDDTLHLALLENYADIYDNGRLTLDPHFAAILSKYHAPVYLATQFYVELRHNPQKDTAFPNEELKHLLEATGFLAEVDEPKPA